MGRGSFRTLTHCCKIPEDVTVHPCLQPRREKMGKMTVSNWKSTSKVLEICDNERSGYKARGTGNTLNEGNF